MVKEDDNACNDELQWNKARVENMLKRQSVLYLSHQPWQKQKSSTFLNKKLLFLDFYTDSLNEF